LLSIEEDKRIYELRKNQLLDEEFDAKLTEARNEFFLSMKWHKKPPGMVLPSVDTLRTVRVDRQELTVGDVKVDMLVVRGLGSAAGLYPRFFPKGLSLGASRLPADGLSALFSVRVRRIDGDYFRTKIAFKTRNVSCSWSNEACAAPFVERGETGTKLIRFWAVPDKKTKGNRVVEINRKSIGRELPPVPPLPLDPKFADSHGIGCATPGWPVGLLVMYSTDDPYPTELLIVDWVKGNVFEAVASLDIKKKVGMYHAFDGRHGVVAVVSNDYNCLVVFDMLFYMEKHHPKMLEDLRKGAAAQAIKE